MKLFDSYRLHFTPLSPIHIGTGECYEPTNYVIEDGALFEFDTGGVVEAFSESERKDLLNIANRRPDVEQIKALQKFFYERRDLLKPFAVNRIPVLPGVGSLYASRVGQTAQREGDGGQVLNKLEIDRCAYNPISRKPVLFGSSLKGAIRTALLDKENRGQRAHEKKGLHEFQSRLLRYRAPERGRLQLELDPLRLVQLADAPWKTREELPATQVHLAVNRKKAPVKGQDGQLIKAMGENLYQILECVPGWRYRAFTGQINLQKVNGVSQRQKLPDPELQYSMQAIASACNRFYLPILTGERKQMRERDYLDKEWHQTVQRTLAAAQDKIQRNEAFLLRVGRHSGAESVTVSGARNGNIRIIKGRGQPPEYADAPKTLWVAADEKDQRTGLIPFGWLLVEIQPLEDSDTEWPELRALCEPHLDQSRAFAARLDRQREQLEQARQQVEERRRAEAELARVKAEQQAQAAREEAERQARLAAMSPQMQTVDEFDRYYQAQKRLGSYKAGSQFDEKRRGLFAEALEWRDLEARHAAAALLRQIIKDWTDWPAKKERKAEFRAWLEQLEA